MRRNRRLVPLVAMMLLPMLSLYTVNVAAHPVSSCLWGGSPHYYALARSYDIRNAAGNGAQAAWEEQNYVVWDEFATTYAAFADAEMWLIISENPFNWVEVGFMRWTGCPGNCFFRAKGENGAVTDFTKLSKAPQGAHTWHLHKIVLSSGTYFTYIDGTSYGGYGGFASSATRIDIGNEVTSTCSTINITYWGSPSTSSSYAFRYRTSGGLWTTWGSGTTYAYHPPYHTEWLTYAIYMRTWGP